MKFEGLVGETFHTVVFRSGEGTTGAFVLGMAATPCLLILLRGAGNVGRIQFACGQYKIQYTE
jgi:hypothetical protein